MTFSVKPILVWYDLSLKSESEEAICIGNHIHSLHWIWKYFVPWILLDRASKYETILNSQAHIHRLLLRWQKCTFPALFLFYKYQICQADADLRSQPANGSKRSIADEDLFSVSGVMRLLLTSNSDDCLFPVSENMSLLLLLMVFIPGLGSNLENLRIVDSLLKQYDRRATPTTNTGIQI